MPKSLPGIVDELQAEPEAFPLVLARGEPVENALFHETSKRPQTLAEN